ncbi:hypothetical protein D1816_11620 [Aquimarina sp. AD10]|uniref:Outer membrane protein beta-barrel domain-containing protein n=1 Tax=Aquimarina aggregata TaxID=1642818 RepID=A0A162YDM0_9FLAO|nr:MULTISPECIES: hypothetical protein [Aquimarina]AXT60967.1 hypothetical protein D1816_11620 [Aquimarina sp. AD10]KZS39068.1 hypothetical protein AWE51_10940 [Aquimarina aggregata]RKM96265.1 hypothetical protein D7033_15355 [Aquimarina sp. AD10]
MKLLAKIAAFVAMTCIAQLLNAQEQDTNRAVEKLKGQKERIITTEKEALKKEVEIINEKLAANQITIEEAQKRKEASAQNHALNIENRLAIIDNKIALLERNGVENINTEDPRIVIGLTTEEDNADVLLGLKINTGKERKIKYDKRTTSNIVLAVGLNNAIVEGQSLDDSDYKIGGSRFFELGWAWKTRVFKNSNLLRFKYGISYTSNGLKPTENRYFVENGDQTNLETFGVELDKSKFRMDNLVIPVHLELGASKVRKTENSIRYDTSRKFRIGFGGYLGVNISTRQKLKFKENGNRIKDKIKRDYNTSDLIYGLSSYVGFGDMTLYAKYDLSPIFRNAIIEQNNVSLGLRFDL